jgi:hypothetical protein
MCLLQKNVVLSERLVLRALQLLSKDAKGHVYKDANGYETMVLKLW